MTRIHHVFLCAVVILILITAGCTLSTNTSGAQPLITGTQTIVAPLVTTAPLVPGTAQPGAAGTSAPGTCTADISSDAANCGGCGYTCPANALCQSGQCYCREGYTAENNQCVPAPAGTSAGGGCPAGMSPCPDGYCYDLSSSAANCGICGNMCPAGMICSASTCTNVPAGTTTEPVTSETTTPVTTVTTSSGIRHIGTLAGVVTKNCVIFGMTNCDGTCVNLTINNGNCGNCGNICSGTKATCCGGACTDLNTDESNCGTCGNKCKTLYTCTAGSCKPPALVKTTTIAQIQPSIVKVIDPRIIVPIGP